MDIKKIKWHNKSSELWVTVKDENSTFGTDTYIFYTPRTRVVTAEQPQPEPFISLLWELQKQYLDSPEHEYNPDLSETQLEMIRKAIQK